MSAVLKPGAPGLVPMTEPDLPVVLAIEEDIYDFPWTHGNFRDSLSAGYSCWLYGTARDLTGYAVVMHAVDEAHLLNLSISRPLQSAGHGARLLQLVMEAARGHGAARMLLEVRPSNAAGRALYGRAGFIQAGMRRGYYPARGGREDALVLTRGL